MKKIILILLLFITQNHHINCNQQVTLSTDLTKYFKKITDKSKNNTMEGIDFIYMINLDQRPEKFALSTQQLAPYGIYPYRFSAVNGWELSLTTINDLGVKYDKSMKKLKATTYLLDDNGVSHHEIMNTIGRTYFVHCLAPGPIGILLSHLSVLHDAYESGYKRILVMEDDIQVIQDKKKSPSHQLIY